MLANEKVFLELERKSNENGRPAGLMAAARFGRGGNVEVSAGKEAVK
jgi:hypothetical protein